jgi:hypothetical protein
MIDPLSMEIKLEIMKSVEQDWEKETQAKNKLNKL